VSVDDQNSSKLSLLKEVKNYLQTNLQTVFSWLDTIDGKILINGISTISPHIIANPVGFLFPFILESADAIVRKRFLKSLSDIGKRLEENESKLDTDYIKTPEGQQLLKNTLRNLIQENNEEKTEYLKQFLINAYVKTDIEKEKIEEYFNILTSLQPSQLQILKIFLIPDNTIDEIIKKISNIESDEILFSLKNNLRDYMEIDEQLFDVYVQKLDSVGLISVKGKAVDWSGGGYYKTHIDQLKSSMNRDAKSMLTPFGKTFIKFIIRNL
jgi:hypothetical protein